MRGIVLDTETTGLLLPSSMPLSKQPKIIELGFLITDGKEVISKHNWIINPGELISEEITKITGITNDDLEGKPSFSDILPEVKELFEGSTVLFCHNAPFDKTMMDNELTRAACNDFPWPTDIICTVAEYMPTFGKRPTLKDLYLRITGTPLAQTHRAIDDVEALYECLIKDDYFEKAGFV